METLQKSLTWIVNILEEAVSIIERNGTMRVNRKHVSSKAMKFPDLDDPWQYDTRESSEERSH